MKATHSISLFAFEIVLTFHLNKTQNNTSNEQYKFNVESSFAQNKFSLLKFRIKSARSDIP